MSRADNDRFEEDVRNIAIQLFPGRSFEGGRFLEGRERDGIFDDGDTIHIFEATTSRKVAKIESDIAKSIALVSDIRREKPSHNVKIWIVTLDPPTVDQETAASNGRKKARCPIEIISYNSLYNRLFDANEFLSLRYNYPFGSVRDPISKSFQVPNEDYIPVGFHNRSKNEPISPNEISNLFTKGSHRSVIVGDYGMGKSMAMKHIFNKMSSTFRNGESRTFPVYLNLRDHFGQSDPAEAFMRHAKKIGVDFNRLIAAWRAGFVDLFLDGFDELSPVQFSTSSRNLKSARRAATDLVSRIVDETPAKSSIIISGRLHYFDSQQEMLIALGIDYGWSILHIDEFSDKQISDYLKLKKWSGSIPPWIPRRPLLIGYLVASGLLSEVTHVNDLSAAEGWDYLLDRVCDREIRQIPGSPIEPKTLRQLMERLATLARSLEGGRGPIAAGVIIQTFEEMFDQAPDARTQTLLLRLPGLSTVPGLEEAREFIDDDFVDACRAGEVIRFLLHPFGEQEHFAKAEIEGGVVCVESIRAHAVNLTDRQISAAIEVACDNEWGVIALDIVKSSILSEHNYDGPRVFISDIYIRNLEIITDVDLSRIRFKDCWIEKLDVMSGDTGNFQSLPTFSDCVIEVISGFKGSTDLPVGKFSDGTKVDIFVGLGHSNAELLMSDDIPLSVAVLLTILKKMFFQAGGGRQEAALYRGLDHRAKSYVPDVLQVLAKSGFIEESGRAGPTVWRACKTKLPEAKSIRDAPVSGTHEVLRAVRGLS